MNVPLNLLAFNTVRQLVYNKTHFAAHSDAEWVYIEQKNEKSKQKSDFFVYTKEKSSKWTKKIASVQYTRKMFRQAVQNFNHVPSPPHFKH